MFEIDYKNLIIRNKNITKNNFFITANITSDWAPILDDVSDLMIVKKKKYYGNLLEYFEKGDLNITNLETVIDVKSRAFNKNALRFINNQALSSNPINHRCLLSKQVYV